MCADRGLNCGVARVFLDGEDVTGLRVCACDDRAGYIEIFKHNARGEYCLDDSGCQLARERRYGHVRVTFS